MADAVLHAQDLTRHYRVSRGLLRGHAVVRALNGVSFALQPARTLAVVGESGCGKSTLARQLTLIEAPTSGALFIDGLDTGAAAAACTAARQQLRQRVQMVFQNPYASLNPRKTIAATLDEPLAINTTLPKAERQARALQMIERVGLRPEHAKRIAVMYASEVVEVQTVPALFERPHHPYTEALLATIPEHSRGARRLPTLAGVVPGMNERLKGCLLAPRCPQVRDECRTTHPGLLSMPDGSHARCLFPLHVTP